MKNVTDIINDYLKLNDFDGLVNTTLECGCGTDDLAPCAQICTDCEPAIEVVPPTDEYDRYFATKNWTKTERIKIKQEV